LKKLEMMGKLPLDKQEILLKSVNTRTYFINRINDLKEQMLQLEEKFHENANGKVRIQNYIYPGTRVSIGKSSLNIKEPIQFCCLYKDSADIRIGSYDK